MKLKEIISEELSKIVKQTINESVYKVYHGTDQKFNRFDFNKTAEGVVWFTDDINSIKNQEHGGVGNKNVMTRYITINKPAGWEEYDKYSLGELFNMGYDGVILPEGNHNNFIVFSNKNISSKPNNITEFDEFDDTVNIDNSSPNLPGFGDRLNSIS